MPLVAGRPSLLTPDLVEEVAWRVAAGEPIGAAVQAAGGSPRTLRRWRAAGRRELDGLSAQARLVLAIETAEQARPEDWQSVAARVVMNEVEWRALAGEPLDELPARHGRGLG